MGLDRDIARRCRRVRGAWAWLVGVVTLLVVVGGCRTRDRTARGGNDGAPFDPCAPPPIVGAGAVSFPDAVRFLYDGACPRQLNADKAAFDDARVAVVVGRVVGLDGAPLRDVRVSAPREGRFGETRSREDGRFEYVIHGDARTRI